MHQFPYSPTKGSAYVKHWYERTTRNWYSRTDNGEEKLQTRKKRVNFQAAHKILHLPYLICHINAQVAKNPRVVRHPVLDNSLLFNRQVLVGPAEVAEEVRDLVVGIQVSRHELPHSVGERHR